jgi:hypothetical protein
MQEIKEVLISRIKDILQLESLQENPIERHKLLLRQKKIELSRNYQELRLLVSLDSYPEDR